MKDIIKFIIASIFLISVTIVGAWALSLEFGVGILSIIPPILAFFSLEAGLYMIFMSSDTEGGNANETSDINDTISVENEAKSWPDNSGKTSDKIESEENDRPVNKTPEPIIEDGSTIQKNKDLLRVCPRIKLTDSIAYATVSPILSIANNEDR
jgi:hypothetical protein